MVKIFGKKQNIKNAHAVLKARIDSYLIRKVYITKYELKILLKNLNYIKKKIYPAEFRI